KEIVKYIILLSLSFVFARFPDAVGTHGMVVSSHKFASEAGLEILRNGGNAIDAAIATGFVLAVVHPGAGNIGGGGFMVIRLADGTVTTIDFRETAPAAAFRDMFLNDSMQVIPGKSWNSSWASGVPGSVAGYGYAHKKYGTAKWKTLLTPAVKLAENGFPLDYLNMNYFNSEYYNAYLSNDPESSKIFSKDGHFDLGESFVQKDLGKTLERIATQGWQEFYRGKTADLLISCMHRTEGLITKADLETYQVVERFPITFDYRGYEIHSMPPASSGGIAIACILNQLENIQLDSLKYHSAQHIHYVAEAERRVYADRAEFLGDMDFVPVPIDRLISDDYAGERWESVDSLKAFPSENITHGDIPFHYNESEETTHFSVVDQWGNAVSVTTTVNGWFGSGIVVGGAGFLLNNEMDDFSSKPGTPNAYGLVGNAANAIEPGKRMLSSMSPTIVETPEGELFLVLGSPGGSTIITTTAQIIMNVIDFGMYIEDAVESPRFHHQWLPDMIQFESSGFSSETVQALEDRGHGVKFRGSIGEANCIQYKDGYYYGSADSRKNANAAGY
ncbi:MAG: gamma-glutamyltransferase, partial [Candidatus Marinimicrobia bacterium]|nr:gamma-glutamyltransferase [Candidatus Neomarinimicrobiota bacterium]